MKNTKKMLLASSLAALALGAVSVGGTFALFTDKAETKVEVGSGVVDIESKAMLVNYTSSVDGVNHDFGSEETSYSNPKVGNSFSIDGSVITISKMVPGDKLTVNLTAVNKSNVKTLTRFMVSHALVGAKQDLFPALKFSFNAGELTPADVFRWQTNDSVSNTEGVNLYGNGGLTMTIELPDSHDGQITFDDDNLDNQYQDCACSIALNLQAVQGNAQVNPIDEINGYLAAETLFEGQNKTMHDAVLDMAEIEYESLTVLEDYVYDLANDQFVKEEGISADYHNYFKVCNGMPDPQKFSVYASPSWSQGNVSLSGIGFDAGDATGISAILYEGVGVAREVAIRTNTAQTSLTVDAPLDTIHHYDALGALNIVKAATNSYHEFGSIAFAEIAKGRIVLEQGSDVNQIHINKKTESSFDTVIIANNGGAAELPEKITRDAVTVEEETLVVKVESKGVSENVYVYADGVTGTKGSTEKVTEGANKQNENVESALGQLVLDNGSEADKAQTVDQKTAAKEEAVEKAVEKEKELKGSGTQQDPFVVYDFDTMQQVSKYFEQGYKYFTVDMSKTDNGVIDCKNTWTPVNLNGYFEGNGVTFKNVNQQLFRTVGEAPSDSIYVIKDITIEANIQINGYGAAAIRQAGNKLYLENVNVHGYIEGNNGAAAFVCFGPGNISNGPANDQAMNWVFKNCYSDATIVATGDVAVGFVKHPYCAASQQGGSAAAQEKCLITIEDSIFEGKLSYSGNGVYTHKYFVGNANDMIVKTSYSEAFLAKHENPEGRLYAAPATKTEDGKFFIGNYPGEGKKVAGYTDYGTCVDSYLGDHAALTKSNGTLPEKYEAFTVAKAANAASAKAFLEIAPNEKVKETGAYLATFMTETINLQGVEESFSTSTIKYFDIQINGAGVTEQGLSLDGHTFNVYDGGAFYGHTYSSATVRVVQYDANNVVIHITTFALPK